MQCFLEFYAFIDPFYLLIYQSRLRSLYIIAYVSAIIYWQYFVLKTYPCKMIFPVTSIFNWYMIIAILSIPWCNTLTHVCHDLFECSTCLNFSADQTKKYACKIIFLITNKYNSKLYKPFVVALTRLLNNLSRIISAEIQNELPLRWTNLCIEWYTLSNSASLTSDNTRN